MAAHHGLLAEAALAFPSCWRYTWCDSTARQVQWATKTRGVVCFMKVSDSVEALMGE